MPSNDKHIDSNLNYAVHCAADQHSIIAVTDVNGIITYVNEKFSQLSGYSREELIGQTHVIVNSGYHPPEFFDKMWCHILEGKAWSGIIQNKAKNGTMYWVDTTIMPVQNSSGEITSFTSIRTDISKLVKETELRKKETIKAQAANKAKSTFLSMMSHELRTPMNGIIGMTQAVLESDLNITQYESMKIIEESSQNLMSTLNNILDISKIEAGKMTLDCRTFVLNDIVQHAIKLWSPEISKKEVEFQTIFKGDLTQSVIGDETRVSQILSNLLSNACKFTDTGHIKLFISAKDENQKMALEFRIEDTGSGIDRFDVAKIFKPFEQADQSTTRKVGGTGLGLPLCQELTQMMGGTLKYDSDYEDGAAFIVKLLLEKATLSEQFAEPSPSAYEPQSHHLKILAAEDSKVNRMVLKAVLAKEPFNLEFAVDGAEAIDLAEKQIFDIILMDIQMPKVDGVEAAQTIRNSNGPNATTPIIAVTANVMDGDREKYLAVGMDGFIPKPINVETLVLTINALQKQPHNKTASITASPESSHVA
jgi:PAS domain S-box-containing protein